MAALGAACCGVLIATAVVTQGSSALGIPHGGVAIASGATAAPVARAARVPSPQGGPATGPAAGEIPSDEHVGPDAHIPAIDNLDPALRQALQAADKAMRANGIQPWITSGWRTVAYQERLYDEAVAQHGAEYARTHVAAPDKTEHTSGRAVDIGPTAADYWLIRNGVEFGLCQTYANEIWHFELTAKDGVCPALRTDALG